MGLAYCHAALGNAVFGLIRVPVLLQPRQIIEIEGIVGSLVAKGQEQRGFKRAAMSMPGGLL